ncbi:DUF3105 domain-containing protein [Patescibacteria group bacterium]|nr:DUF3105 domain-containing protein [Patescibacteria group bacterium]
MNSENSNKVTYEEKKAQREKKNAAKAGEAKQKRMTKSLTNWGIVLVVLVALGYGGFFLVKGEFPQGEDVSQAFKIQGREHIAVGEEHPPYSSNPPSSGWHYGQTVQAGFYDVGETVPDENVIHNLEHGDIWVAYLPIISEEARGKLREFAAGKVIITPRETNDFDVALVAWGRVDSFNLEEGGVQGQRIEDFITRYANRGPERVSAVGGHRR